MVQQKGVEMRRRAYSRREALAREVWKNRWFYLFLIPAIVVIFFVLL